MVSRPGMSAGNPFGGGAGKSNPFQNKGPGTYQSINLLFLIGLCVRIIPLSRTEDIFGVQKENGYKMM